MKRYLNPQNLDKYKLFFCKGFSDFQYSEANQKKINSFISKDKKGSSFLVYDQSALDTQLKRWKEAIDFIKIRFAVKASPHPLLLKDLADRNVGFDVASQLEVEDCLKYGAKLENMIYSNPIKNMVDLEYAYKNGVRLTTADSIEELIKIKEIAPDMKVIWRVVITENASAKVIKLQVKFGDQINVSDEVALKRFKDIKDMGINIEGINFHCGSSHYGADDNFQNAVRESVKLMNIGKSVGHSMSILDTGGGLSGTIISDRLIGILSQLKNQSFEVLSEPGRFISSNCFNVLTKVIGKQENQKGLSITINDSIHHAFNKFIFDNININGQKDQFQTFRDENDVNQKLGNQRVGTIFGQTNQMSDVIASDIVIPENIEIGDWICWQGMGAYTYCAISDFYSMKSCERTEVL